MVVLTGGGTGGHLAGIKVLKDAFITRGVNPVYIGSTNGLPCANFFDQNGFSASYLLNTRTVMDRGWPGRVVSVVMNLLAVKKAAAILGRHKIKAVVSVGGYAASAPLLAALIRSIPVFIHEHNCVMGRVHKLVSPYAREFFSSYDDRSPVKDYPVQDSFFKKRRIRRQVKRILFLGGSQGSTFINDLAIRMAPLLQTAGIRISHQTGHKDFDRVKSVYREFQADVDVFDFDDDMASQMALADFAVTRAGAGTLWELAANGLPALFIPYPYASEDHQYHNARFLADKGLGFVARQPEVSDEVLFSAIRSDLTRISTQLMSLIQPASGDKIVRYILDSIKPAQDTRG